MRIIITFIFFVLLASTAKAQTDFDFTCELTCSDATAAIAAIPEAMMDADDGTFYDRTKYMTDNITAPDGFSFHADDEQVVIHEGMYPGGTQIWYETNYQYEYTYDQFNTFYKNIHRMLINLEYGCELKDGVIEIN